MAKVSLKPKKNFKYKIDMISDLHMDKPNLVGGDILLCAGDLTYRGTIDEVDQMLHWLNEQDYSHIILVAGNHDFLFEKNPGHAEALLKKYPHIIYLNDSGTQIDDLKIWGSPVQPWFHNWAFNRYRGDDIQKHWDLIPDKVDILITHGPPNGILDLTMRSQEHVGCAQLLKKIEKIKPKIHLFGHIHEGYGIVKQDGTLFVNASIMDFHYSPVNEPVIAYL